MSIRSRLEQLEQDAIDSSPAQPRQIVFCNVGETHQEALARMGENPSQINVIFVEARDCRALRPENHGE